MVDRDIGKAIAKLLIATMIIDSHRDDREYTSISGIIEILGISSDEFDILINESSEINGFNEVTSWVEPEINKIRLLKDHEICSTTIANMVLIAHADNIVLNVEEEFIKATAKSFGVPAPI